MAKILIIDDDRALAEMYETKFKIEGFETLLCTEWLAALWVVSDFNPDVILLDVMMPQIDGFEVLSAIKNLASSLKAKIVMFSNLSWADSINRGLELWANLYLVKAETTPRDAVEKITKLLEKEQHLAEHGVTLRKDSENHELICPHCGKNVRITLR